MSTILVGRSPWGAQKQKIENQSVSRRHLELTSLGHDTWKIRDVGSSFGTFVKGLPIVETEVELDDPIIMGDFQTTVRQLLGLNQTAGEKSKIDDVKDIKIPPIKKQGTVEYVSVANLEKVYLNYQDALKRLAKQKAKANVMRMLPMQLVMPLALGLTGILLPDDTSGRLIKGAVMVGVMSMTVFMSQRLISVSTNQIDEQYELTQQFQTDYVCPKCKNFFGAAKPYKALLNQGQCPFCKSKFRESNC